MRFQESNLKDAIIFFYGELLLVEENVDDPEYEDNTHSHILDRIENVRNGISVLAIMF